jgi:predicted RNA-binding protein associated with RNAse of E/G family
MPESPDLPTITETKRTLDGRTKRFACRVVARTPDAIVLLYVSDRPYQVADVALPVATVTLATYWRERPYNVYHWLTPAGETLAYYFNLSAETEIATDELRWLDLTLDVLVRPGRAPEVLDEDELPADLSGSDRQRIDAALARVHADAPALTIELERAAATQWPLLFRGARRSP